MNYIWFDEETPILQQVSNDFKSAAILLHPFVQMPTNWTETKKTHPFQRAYPNNEEDFRLGKPVQWHEVMKRTGLSSVQEVAISLMTSISAFTPEFANTALANQLNAGLNNELYYPTEDTISFYLLENILTLFRNTGTATINFVDPVEDVNLSLDIASITPEYLTSIAAHETLITDEKNELAFLSIYDSFTTILLYKHNDIEKLTKHFEHIICDKETTVNWYLMSK